MRVSTVCGMDAIKRYDPSVQHCGDHSDVEFDEDPNGDWMKADEVEARVAEFEESKRQVVAMLDGLRMCSEYSDSPEVMAHRRGWNGAVDASIAWVKEVF